jgi:hypothetical protein
MATIKKLLKESPRMRGVTPVPNGPLIKKKGEFKGSTLKKGGVVKKAQEGYITKDKKGYTQTVKTMTKKGPRYYQSTSPDLDFVDRINMMKIKANSADSIPKAKVDPKALETLDKKKKGGIIKKAKSGAWQRKEGKDPKGGLNRKGIASYRRENPGSKLSMAVTTKPSKLKPGSKAANRRKSFCSRMSGMKKKLTSAKTANDPNSRINKSLRKWNC